MKPDYSNTYLLFGLLTIGQVNISVLTKAALVETMDDKPPIGKVIDSAQIGDYNDDSDDLENSAEQGKAISLKSTVMPYFEEKTKTTYVKPGKAAVLDCPVINYNDSRHSILWYKEKHIITNGLHPISDSYEVDKGFNLMIKQVTDETPGNYYCYVMPQNISRYTLVKMDDKDQTNGKNRQTILSGSVAAITCIFMLQTFLTSPHLKFANI